MCPSCAGRRMANSAAHLVDRVLPRVTVRQFVLSLPFELRPLAAFKADVLTALSRIFVEAIFTVYRRRARANGLTGAESSRGSSRTCKSGRAPGSVGGGCSTRLRSRIGPTRCQRPTRSTGAPPSRWRGAHTSGSRATTRTRGSTRRTSAHQSRSSQPIAMGSTCTPACASTPATTSDCRYGARPPLALDRLRRLPGGPRTPRQQSRASERSASARTAHVPRRCLLLRAARSFVVRRREAPAKARPRGGGTPGCRRPRPRSRGNLAAPPPWKMFQRFLERREL